MTKFLKNISNWGGHRPLLWLALENSRGPILELGMGQNSTPYLQEYCLNNHRNLVSFDNNGEYFQIGEQRLFSSKFLVESWDQVYAIIDHDGMQQHFGVVLIDHAPAERRHVDAIRLKGRCQIMVVHDAEHEGKDYDVYHITKVTEHFKYRLDHAIPGMPAKTLLLSNTIDVSAFKIPEFSTV